MSVGSPLNGADDQYLASCAPCGCSAIFADDYVKVGNSAKDLVCTSAVPPTDSCLAWVDGSGAFQAVAGALGNGNILTNNGGFYTNWVTNAPTTDLEPNNVNNDQLYAGLNVDSNLATLFTWLDMRQALCQRTTIANFIGCSVPAPVPE